MADCDIFREQLAIKYPKYGHALWEPGPSDPDTPVQVGDVGFIRDGRFNRLFNALLPGNDPSHEYGVPEDHEQLVPKLNDRHLKGYPFARNHYCSSGVNTGPDPAHHARQGDIPQVTIKCDGTRAAVLSVPVTGLREDTLAQGDFSTWIVKHIDSWFAFARNLGLGIERREEIILVTGCDRTKSWANIAFFGNRADSHVSFGVRVENSDPPITSDPTITFQFSLENAQGAVLRHGPEGENLPENQCVFIRGYRVARSIWKLPGKRLKAAAGPSEDPDGYDCDPDMEVISIPAISKYRDPLYVLLDYIAEQASDCDMVLAHDDDLANIDGLGLDSSLETLEPEVMMDLLRRSNMEIHKVPCASTHKVSATDSGPNTIVKIAMLSMKSQDWDIEPQCQGSPLAQDIDLSSASEFRVSDSFPSLQLNTALVTNDAGVDTESVMSDSQTLYSQTLYSPTLYSPTLNSPTLYGPTPYLPHPGRRVPLQSKKTLARNWFPRSGFSVTGTADVEVPVDDLRPRFKVVQTTLDAIEDIRFCGKLFDKWMNELDKVPSADNPDGREQKLRLYLGRLTERSGMCLDTTNKILRYHVRFASLIAKRFDDASKSHDLKDDDFETTRLAKEIRNASNSLSVNVERTKYELKSFVSILQKEKVQVAVQNEQSLTGRILRWLKSLFQAIKTIFAQLLSSISDTDRHHPDPKIRNSRLAGTALGQAASEFCKVDSEPQEGKESESLDSVILFFKEIVPREAKNAQKTLERSDEPIKIMERMRAGQRVILYGSDAAAVAEEWRDVAKQYQSAFEQNESCS